jgi:hypothetical protein
VVRAHAFAVVFVGGPGLTTVVKVLRTLGKAVAALTKVVASTAVVVRALWWLADAPTARRQLRNGPHPGTVTSDPWSDIRAILGHGAREPDR